MQPGRDVVGDGRGVRRPGLQCGQDTGAGLLGQPTSTSSQAWSIPCCAHASGTGAGTRFLSPQAVSVWHRRFKASGTDGLRSKGPRGPAPRLSDQQLATVEQALLEGATANRFVGELWTLERIALVTWRLTGVRHHPAHVWAILSYRLGWSAQRPRRVASEPDQDAIDRWVAERWPQITAFGASWASRIRSPRPTGPARAKAE
jgi:transposase